MEKVYVGRIVSTHGIKGEVKILSDFQFKEKVFKIGNNLIIDDKDYTIRSYDNINDILFLLKKKVYFDKDSLKLNSMEVLDSDLLSYKLLTDDGKCGIIKEIFFGGANNKIIRAMFDREVLIPFNSPMILKIDKEKKEVIVRLIEGI